MMKNIKHLSLFPEWELQFAEQASVQQLKETIKPSAHAAYRQRIKRYENEHLLKGVPREGFLEMPKAQPVHLKHIPDLFVPFNCLKSCNTTHACVHFFINDYLFKRVWGRLEWYLNVLSKYDVVLSTDDSVYLDVPLIDNMRNVFKNRVFTAVGQRMGVNVVPTFSCGNPKYIDLYCDGLPEGGCIAVGGMGTNRTRSERAIFKYCVQEMCKRKHPEMLLVYGSNVGLELNIPVIKMSTFVENLRNRTQNEETRYTI